MTREDLKTLVDRAIESLKRAKGLNLQAHKVIEHDDIMNFEILYDAPGTTIQKITLSFHTDPLPEFDFETDWFGIAKTIVKRIYTEVKMINDIVKTKNP